MSKMHIDLFSGIGGFALAAESVWPGIEHVFCDNDSFCQAVLKKHWPTSKIYGDIRAFRHSDWEVQGQRREDEGGQKSESSRSDRPLILTGGFPCQPFSQAGRRKGTADDRYLWPEMLRVISEFHPRWVIAENVGGLVTWNDGMVLEQVCLDLESEGYEVQPFIIPAVSVNAPHRRDRIWFVAHINSPGLQAEGTEQQTAGAVGKDTSSQNTLSQRSGGGMESSGQVLAGRRAEIENARPSWESNWVEVATQLLTLDDGLPSGLVRPRGWRNAALKATGNAIVPQVARMIMLAIKEYERPL